MPLNQFGQSEIPNALMSGWAVPDDSQMEAGVAALAAVVGEPESARASLQRRLVLAPDGWRLLVSEPGFLSNNDYGLLQFTKGASDGYQVALPIGQAIELLRSKDNPELELQRRKNRLAELAERHRLQAEAEHNARLAAAKRQTDAAENAKTYRHSDFAALDVWQQAFYSLALRVQDRDPQLAADLKSVAGASRGVFGERSTPIAAPNARWWP
ncbi:MAG: hypothetical protein WCG85_02350 [Polyangia bacterium]